MKLFSIVFFVLLISLFEFLPIGNIELISSLFNLVSPFYFTLAALLSRTLLYIVIKKQIIIVLILINVCIITFKNSIRLACTRYVYEINNEATDGGEKTIFAGLELKKSDSKIKIFSWHCLAYEQFTLVYMPNHQISDSNEGTEIITILNKNWYINRIPFFE